MMDPTDPFVELLKKDRRYPPDAYVFVWEALNFAQEELSMGKEVPSDAEHTERGGGESRATRQAEHHVTGQELCEAIRCYALRQYGFMAKTVLNSWGIHRTGDFGEIVFNLIRIGRMRKTKNDRREDFDDNYDFETAFQHEFKITAE